jgi:hypothetical protein
VLSRLLINYPAIVRYKHVNFVPLRIHTAILLQAANDGFKGYRFSGVAGRSWPGWSRWRTLPLFCRPPTRRDPQRTFINGSFRAVKSQVFH